MEQTKQSKELKDMTEEEILVQASQLLVDSKLLTTEFDADDFDFDNIQDAMVIVEDESAAVAFLGTIAAIGLKVTDPDTLVKLQPLAVEFFSRISN